MAQSAKAGSTQKFIEIKDISEEVVLFNNGNACSIIEVTASNFALLSKQEQDAKIYSYASLLNSLSFPIQIVIKNKKVDISAYLKSLDAEVAKSQNQLLAGHIRLYREFVENLVKINTVLDKKFYMVIPFSPLEKGVTGAATAAKASKGQVGTEQMETAKKVLHSKTDALHTQLARLSLPAKTLQKEDLVKLFYSIFNQDLNAAAQVSDTVNVPIVKMAPKA